MELSSGLMSFVVIKRNGQIAMVLFGMVYRIIINVNYTSQGLKGRHFKNIFFNFTQIYFYGMSSMSSSSNSSFVSFDCVRSLDPQSIESERLTDGGTGGMSSSFSFSS